MNPTIESLIIALQKSWTSDTSYIPSIWSDGNPARGQCTVSSLVVQHYLGGELLRYEVTGEDLNETHYCNVLPNGTLLDTTFSQYIKPVTLKVKPFHLNEFATIREKRLSDVETRLRYEKLLSRVAKCIK